MELDKEGEGEVYRQSRQPVLDCCMGLDECMLSWYMY